MTSNLSIKDRFIALFNYFKDDKLSQEHFEECADIELLVRSAALFSSNEDLADLQASYAKYLLIDFLVASITECFQTNRLENLKLAHNYYFNFLNQIIRYDLISKDFPERPELLNYFIEDKNEDNVREEKFVNWLQNVPRDLKIDRMKRIIRLKSVCNNFIIESSKNVKIDENENEDENCFDHWVLWINCCVLITLDRLGILFKEIELLEKGQSEANFTLSNSKNTNKTSNSNTARTKFVKPFKLVRDRKQVTEGVFQYGHNLPTMTIEEYLNLEMRRGNFISGGGAASAIKKEIDEDDDRTIEIELKKAREFDEYKDLHTRGSGNTYNRS